MPDVPPRRRDRPLSWSATLGLALGVAAVTALVVDGMGYRLGWWPLLPAIGLATWAAYGAALGLAVSLVGLVRARSGGGRRGLAFALLGAVASLAVVVPAAGWKHAERTTPPINDISTDTETPPVFWEMPNPTDYPGGETARLQHAAYPGIRPLDLAIPPARAYALALALVRERGWQVVAEQPDEGRIEAVDRSLLFGFPDEVVIRVSPTEAGARVDMRSRSRIGRRDRGVNAKRIAGFLAVLGRQARAARQ